jgi:hypothetical protein
VYDSQLYSNTITNAQDLRDLTLMPFGSHSISGVSYAIHNYIHKFKKLKTVTFSIKRGSDDNNMRNMVKILGDILGQPGVLQEAEEHRMEFRVWKWEAKGAAFIAQQRLQHIKFS